MVHQVAAVPHRPCADPRGQRAGCAAAAQVGPGGAGWRGHGVAIRDGGPYCNRSDGAPAPGWGTAGGAAPPPADRAAPADGPRLARLARRPRAARQRGAAVLLALFITALATLIVTSLFWSQFTLFRTIENQELAAQSRLLLRGAVDWARAILREDQRSSAQDSLAEPWAQGLAPTRLDQLGETAELARRATISGAIEDAQARLNLRNLVGPTGTLDEREVASLRRLADLLGAPSGTAELIAERMRRSLPPPEGGTPPPADAPPRLLPLLVPQDLAGVAGIDPAAARALAPFVVVLDQPTPVNVNTAAAEVIAARVADVTLAQARALVASRERLGYFRDLADVRNHLRVGVAFTDRDLAVTTRYFLVRGEVVIDRAVTRMEALLRRGDNAQVPTTLVWQRDS